MKEFGKVWKFTARELLLKLLVLTACGLLGIVFVFAVVKIVKTDDYALLSGFMVFFIWLLLEVWGGMIQFEKDFGMMISMNRTRKSFFWNYLCSNLINNVIKAGVAAGFAALDLVVARNLYGNLACDLDMSSFVLDYRVLVAAVLLSTGLRMLLGVLYLRYGLILFWIVWGIMVGGGWLIGFISDKLHEQSFQWLTTFFADIAKNIVSAGGVIQVAAIGVIFGLLTAVAGILTGKQAVKC